MTPSKKKFALIPVALSVAAFLLLSHPLHAESTPFRGVPGSRQPLYERKGDTWTCLDGSKTIPYSAINDDYCDCADASDEPGTSACPNGRFWCANAGHIPSYIKSSRVNDGVCDSECCDGSDETSGLTACANTCREVGAKHRERQREVNRLLEDGARVKRELIKFGEEKKIEREVEKQKLETEIAALRVKVDELRAIRDQAESAQTLAKVAADNTTKPATTCPPCPRCLRGSAAGSTTSDLKVAALRSHLAVVQGHLDTLLLILHDMKRDHNQNYHDLAVKSAISGYDELVEEWDKQKDDIKKDLDELDVPDDDDASVAYDEDFLDDDMAEEVVAEEVAAEDAAAEDEEVKRTSEGKSPSEPVSGTLSLLSKLSAYVPAFVKDVVQKTTGKVWDGEAKDELSRAQEALNGPQDELNDKLRQLSDVDDKLAKNYGLNQEWAKLEDQCFELNEGEYTYSLCILGQAHQKSNRDHSSTFLGKFSAFTGNSDQTSEEHYAKQLYSEGTRCWNGPDRSVKATFECGLTTELFSVTEPEKCEYAFDLRSPAVCPSVVKEGGKPAAAEEKSSPAREEL